MDGAGAILRSPGGFGVEMRDGCNGINVTILLWAAILAFPAPWKLKAYGLAVGTLAITGDYTQTADGILNVGLGASSSDDELTVSGAASLSGSLVRLAQRLHCKVKKTLFDGLLGARGRIESELENGRGQRAEA